MKRALLILSIGTLVILVLAMVGQILIVTMGIVFNEQGVPRDPSFSANVVTYVAGIGGILAIPATLATFVVGLVAMGARKQYGWVVALCVAGGLSFVGLIGMAVVLLSGNSPVAFVTPLVLVSLVALVFGLRPVSGNAYVTAA